MGVPISKFPHRASVLLEYMSLIRYAARYHRGLGWCAYDIKFRHKAAANKSLKWSTIDSQLRLKTFTVAPSLLKEDISVFQSGPSSSSTSTGTENRTCQNYSRGIPYARTPCIKEGKVNPPAPEHPPPRKVALVVWLLLSMQLTCTRPYPIILKGNLSTNYVQS